MGFRTGLHPLGGGIKDPYKKETVLFESATPGTYNLNLAGDGVCLVYCIGAGAGGNQYRKLKNYSLGGGSAAGFIGEVRFSKGILPITIGGAGNQGQSGGASVVSNIVTANGGIVGGGTAAGSGGTIGVNMSFVVGSPQLQTNGNGGAKAEAQNNYPFAAGGASVWGGYGAGGSGPSGSGTAGYVKIVYKRLKP